MNRLIIIAEAPWALDPLRASGETVIELPAGGRNFTERIITAADFAETDEELCDLPIGCLAFGDAVDGAFEAAALRPWGINALVAVDGNFDVALSFAGRVRTPTLLIVSHGMDRLLSAAGQVIESLSEYGEIERATDTDDIVRRAHAWFERHLGAAQREPALDTDLWV